MDTVKAGDLQEREPIAVVGIGASAGGLASLEEVFARVDEFLGFAFVVVVHFPADVKSFLTQILSRHTAMPVVDVADGMILEPDTVYVSLPGKATEVRDGRFKLAEVASEHPLRPVDGLFRSLAECFGEHAVGVVLSGTGSDGAAGVRAIREAGGMTIVESPRTAKFDGMPSNAIASGSADVVVTREQIGEVLTRHGNKSLLTPDAEPEINPDFNNILKLLANRHDVDFSKYKPMTIVRRLDRRLRACGVQSLREYLRLLDQDPDELDTLYSGLLIGVTEFFRDPHSFELLADHLARQIDALGPDDELRIWVAGCSTGEEAYSLAILAHEVFTQSQRDIRMKVLATDIDENALARAARGFYRREQLEHLPQPRVERYFHPDGPNHVRVIDEIRRRVIFSRHNLVEDPPFTKLHVVACRNLLIYLERPTQQVAIASCHFALRPNGILFLGSSEVPVHLETEFEVIDLSAHLYRKLRDAAELVRNSPVFADRRTRSTRAEPALTEVKDRTSRNRVLSAFKLLLEQFVGDALLVDSKRCILFQFGDAHRWLEPEDNTEDLLSRLPQRLWASFSAALEQSAEGRRAISLPQVEFAERTVDISIQAFAHDGADGCYWLIEFGDVKSKWMRTIHESNRPEDLAAETPPTGLPEESPHVLRATIDALQKSVEQIQATNQDLIAANHELQSANEKFHGMNEELFAVNAENQSKIAQLQSEAAEFTNLAEASDLGTILLDEELRIVRFTQAATEFFYLVEHDIGRPLRNFSHRLLVPDIFERLERVARFDESSVLTCEDEVGQTVVLKLVPFKIRPADGESAGAGVVLTVIAVPALEHDARADHLSS
ncbi:MAG: chemotaxis protein CheB [Planctomycetota bacterium]